MKQSRGLQFRFQKWWKQCGFRGNPLSVYRVIERRYSESHRAYHTLSHLAYSFDQLDRVSRKMRNPLAVEGALWFHDIEYNPHREDNEERSAILLRRWLLLSGASRVFVQRMTRMILQTKHTEMSRDLDVQFLLDLDLSILAAGEATFSAYDEGIRIEYHFVPEEVYRDGRKVVLQKLLERPRIFQTSLLRRLFEIIARKNVRASIEKLERGRNI